MHFFEFSSAYLSSCSVFIFRSDKLVNLTETSAGKEAAKTVRTNCSCACKYVYMCMCGKSRNKNNAAKREKSIEMCTNNSAIYYILYLICSFHHFPQNEELYIQHIDMDMIIWKILIIYILGKHENAY